MSESELELLVFERRAEIAAALRAATRSCRLVTVVDGDDARAISTRVDALLLSPIEAEKWGSRPRAHSEVLTLPPGAVAEGNPPFVVVGLSARGDVDRDELVSKTLEDAIATVKTFNRSAPKSIWRLGVRSSLLEVERIGPTGLGRAISSIVCGRGE